MAYGEPHVDLMISEYNRNPAHNYAMDDFTVMRHEGNFICGDDIDVYLKIENNIVIDWSFAGNTGAVTTAAASLLSEIIIGKSLDEVMEWGYETIAGAGLNVLPRRRRAAVIALLGTRNAIHKFMGEDKIEEFEDMLDD